MPRSHRRTLGRLALLAVVSAALPAAALAQETWPSRPVRLVIPYPPGGTTDIVGRALAEAMSRELGQPVQVDNRPGGGTNIGADQVVNARPDGYTVLFGGITQVVNPTFGPKPSFDTLTALEPVGQIASAPFMIAANPALPIGSAKELIAAAKAKPDRLTVSSAQLDLFVELLNERAGMKLLHVPYKGGAPASADAIGGQVDMVFAQVPALLTHLRGGRLKPIAVTSESRFPALPDTPTFREIGIDYDVNPWFAMFAPAGTPKPVIARLSQAMQAALTSPAMIERIRSVGAEPGFSTPDELAARMRRDTAFWQDVAKQLPHLVRN